MNNVETKNSVYNMVCAALCDYETAEYSGQEDAIQAMYDILCIIQREWDNLLNPDIEPLTPLE